MDYALLDPEESSRLNVRPLGARRRDSSWSSVVRAPVPWHQGFVVAKQFCRHNLFVTNPILLRIQIIWVKRWESCHIVRIISKVLKFGL